MKTIPGTDIPILECPWMPADAIMVADLRAVHDIFCTPEGVKASPVPRAVSKAQQKACLRRIMERPRRVVLVKNISNPPPRGDNQKERRR